jgi:hypothetical protein
VGHHDEQPQRVQPLEVTAQVSGGVDSHAQVLNKGYQRAGLAIRPANIPAAQHHFVFGSVLLELSAKGGLDSWCVARLRGVERKGVQSVVSKVRLVESDEHAWILAG